jgi:wobble nucleotide-excising tRNase
VDVDHGSIAKIFEGEVNSLLRGKKERQPSKKRSNVFRNVISNFFVVKDPFKKDDVYQKQFLENLGLLVVKKIYQCYLLTICG